MDTENPVPMQPATPLTYQEFLQETNDVHSRSLMVPYFETLRKLEAMMDSFDQSKNREYADQCVSAVLDGVDIDNRVKLFQVLCSTVRSAKMRISSEIVSEEDTIKNLICIDSLKHLLTVFSVKIQKYHMKQVELPEKVTKLIRYNAGHIRFALDQMHKVEICRYSHDKLRRQLNDYERTSFEKIVLEDLKQELFQTGRVFPRFFSIDSNYCLNWIELWKKAHYKTSTELMVLISPTCHVCCLELEEDGEFAIVDACDHLLCVQCAERTYFKYNIKRCPKCNLVINAWMSSGDFSILKDLFAERG